ncbi:MAG: hypothetical protein ABSH28_13705 [Acidobacteriota bacterium]
MQEALSLDPAHAEAKAALDRCRDEKAAAGERIQRAESPKTVPFVAKSNYGRRAAIGLLAVGIVAVVIWVVANLGKKGTISSAVAEMEFVSIPAGKFTMGCSAGDSQCSR